jgi:ribosomal protein L18E
MPLQRRLPKRGFKSLTREDTAEVLLSDLERVKAEKIDLAVLKEAGVVPGSAKRAKVIVSGKLTRKVALVGIAVSKGARSAIEATGGSTDAPIPQPKPKREPKAIPTPQAQAEGKSGKEAAKPETDKPAQKDAKVKGEARGERKAEAGKTAGQSKPGPEGKKGK